MTRRRPGRGSVLVGLAVLVAFAAAVWTTAGGEQYPDPLDPRNPGPEGAQALAEVLDDEGVEVEVVRSAEDLEDTRVERGTTVLVTGTDALSPSTLRRLREHAGPGRLVLVEPSYLLVEEIDGRLLATSASADGLDADCTRASRDVGGPAGVGLDDLRLEVDGLTVFSDTDGAVLDGATCFASTGGSVVAESTAEDLLLFGAGEALSNDQVLRADNAAIALRLVGTGERVVWYVPDPADATADEAVSLGSLLPRWIGPGLWLGALALVALVLWRFRRLGPLSTEPLPVVVRAVETARSRGRMYRRSGDRSHAAAALRRAARTDLAARLGVDRRAGTAAVVEAAARHLGAPQEPLAALLDDHSPPPATDQELVRLGQELAQLRREVRRG